MTASAIIKQAVDLLGYTSMGDTEERYMANAITAINSVYADLFYLHKNTGFKRITSAADTLDLDERLLVDVMPYGVAAMLAQTMGDGDSQQYYATMYNLKRKALGNTTIEDVIEGVDG